MKKLMIAMTTIASLALVVKAEATNLGGEDFNKMNLDATISTAVGSSYWTRSNGATEGESMVKGDESNHYLKVDESETLMRTICDQQDSVKTQPITADANVIVAAKVQFTAADEVPQIDDGVKVAIWLKATEADSETGTLAMTNLVVSAAELDGNNDLVLTDYVIDSETFSVEEKTWYDLTVTTSVSAEDMTEVVVSINAEGNEPTVLGTYLSRVQTGDYKSTITGVGFKGTGAVDDIAFTSESIAPGTIALEIVENADVTIGTVTADEEEVDVAAIPDSVTEIFVEVTVVDGKVIESVSVGEYIEDDGQIVIEVNDETVVDGKITLTITTKDAGDPSEKTWDDVDAVTTEVVPAGIDPTTVSLEALKEYAETYNIKVTEITSADPVKFALNLAPAATDDAVNTAKANFKVTITMEDGKPVVTAPEGYNVTPVIKGSPEVNGEYVAPYGDDARFFKGEISVLIVK